MLDAGAREPRARRLPGLALRPVPLFAAAAALFLAGYGAYVYIAVTNPGLLSGASRSETREPPPLAVGTARPPVAPKAGTPMPELLEPAPSGAPVAAPAPAVPPTPASAANAELAARQGPSSAPGTEKSRAVPGESGALAGQTLTLSSADDLTSLPRSKSRPPAALKRPTPTARSSLAGDEPLPPERTRARPSSGVPVVPAEDRVNVRATEVPRGLSARIEEAWGNAQRGRLAEAEAGYEAVLAMDQRNIDALLGLASIAWQQGRTERAGEFYGRVLELDPQNAAAQSGLIGLLGMTDPVASETRLRDLIAREPSGQLFFTLGNLHARQSQWAQAQRAFFQAFQSEPGNPDYAFNLAVSLDRLGQPRPALQYYRKAVELSLAQGRAGFDQKAAVARIAQLASTEAGAQ